MTRPRAARLRAARLFALAALAVTAAVALSTGGLVVRDAVHAASGAVHVPPMSRVAAVVRASVPPRTSALVRPRVPAGVLAVVRRVPGVMATEGVTQGAVEIRLADGRSLPRAGAAAIGISWDPGAGVGALRPASGHAPRDGSEVALDAGTAARAHVHVGQAVTIRVTDATLHMQVAGTFCVASRCDLPAATVSAFDARTARRLFHASGSYDVVTVRAAGSMPPAALRTRLRGALPTYDVASPDAFAAETGRALRGRGTAVPSALLVLGGIALTLGAWAARVAWKRCAPARRSGFARAVMLGAAAAVVSCAAGLLMGLALAREVVHVMRTNGLDVAPAGAGVPGRVAAIALVVAVSGILAGVTAAVSPPLRTRPAARRG